MAVSCARSFSPIQKSLSAQSIFPCQTISKKGSNKIELDRSGNRAALNAAVITSYYIPWADSEATHQQAFKSGDTRALRLEVHYHQTETQVGNSIHCVVEAERIGFQGYGMIMAEVGLPPGAEVDRASLEKANSPPGVFGYEVQPDRVVFYLWPQAGGISVGFDFRMRYRVQAMSAASLINDYYNPESNATIEPVPFTIR